MQPSDEALVDEVRTGSTLAFGLLMKRHEKKVYRIAYAYTRTPDNAMDVTQNTFFKAYRNIDSYSGAGTVAAWLMTIARNEAASWLRKHRKERFNEELTPLNTPVTGPVQEGDAERRQLRALLCRELGRLKPRELAAINLRYFEDCSLREIAQVLDTSEGTVKSILFRSIEKLRQFTTFRRDNDYAQL